MAKRVILHVEDLPSRAIGLSEDQRKQILGGGLFKKKKKKNGTTPVVTTAGPRVKKKTFGQ